MARSITYREAINEALAQEMERDPSVIVMGEDNAGGQGSPGEDDAWGGVLGVTKGLYHKFPGRVLDAPISEDAMVGSAVGAAIEGMRPIVEMQFADFSSVGFSQIVNQAATLYWRTGVPCPLTIRMPSGGNPGSGGGIWPAGVSTALLSVVFGSDTEPRLVHDAWFASALDATDISAFEADACAAWATRVLSMATAATTATAAASTTVAR